MLHITDHKTGLKMTRFISINTSVRLNPFCNHHIKQKCSICRYCYARHMEITYRNLSKLLEGNYQELKTPLSENSLNDIVRRLQEKNRHYIRFHALGELTGPDHLRNFYNIAGLMPGHIFGLWTKRKDIVKIAGTGPGNISMIYSNPVLDKPLKWVPDGFNGLFNVVSYEYARDHDIRPNCTGHCITCLKCYDPGKKSVIIELLKKDQTKIKKGQLEPLE